MRQDIQKAAKAVGATGCYYLSVLSLAENLGAVDVDPLKLFDVFVSRGWLGEDAYMKDPAAILSHVTGKRWWCKKAGPGHELALDYPLGAGEHEILRFERSLRPGEAASAETAHFVRGRGAGVLDQGRILWDPWTGSSAVREGKVASRRVFGRA